MAVDDSYTKLLLHMDGTVGSTSFTDEAGHTVTALGNAQIVADGKFSQACGLDGASSLSMPDSADWRLDDGDDNNAWTIDLQFYTTDSGADQCLITQYQGGDEFWSLEYQGASNQMQFRVRSGGVNIITFSPTCTLTANVWNHIAITSGAGGLRTIYVNGTGIGSNTDASDIPNFSGNLYIGKRGDDSTFAVGKVDEARLSKGIRRWTADFTPPSSPYAPPAPASNGNFLQLF